MGKNIGNNIRVNREKIEMSKFTLASHLGITEAEYVKIEDGIIEINADQLYAIAKILNVSIYDILPDDKPTVFNEYLLRPVFDYIRDWCIDRFKRIRTRYFHPGKKTID